MKTQQLQKYFAEKFERKTIDIIENKKNRNSFPIKIQMKLIFKILHNTTNIF